MAAIASIILLFISLVIQAHSQCTDSTGSSYSTGQTWTEQSECIVYKCQSGGEKKKISACATPEGLDTRKCMTLPGKKGPFPQCCPEIKCYTPDAPNKKIIDVPMQKVKGW